MPPKKGKQIVAQGTGDEGKKAGGKPTVSSALSGEAGAAGVPPCVEAMDTGAVAGTQQVRHMADKFQAACAKVAGVLALAVDKKMRDHGVVDVS